MTVMEGWCVLLFDGLGDGRIRTGDFEFVSPDDRLIKLAERVIHRGSRGRIQKLYFYLSLLLLRYGLIF